MAYCLVISFSPSSAYLRTEAIPKDQHGNLVHIPKILRCYKTTSGNVDEFSEFMVVRCDRCDGNNPLLCCFVSTGHSRTGKCVRCKSQPCSFVAASGAALARQNIAKLAGAALRDSAEGQQQLREAAQQAIGHIG